MKKSNLTMLGVGAFAVYVLSTLMSATKNYEKTSTLFTTLPIIATTLYLCFHDTDTNTATETEIDTDVPCELHMGL